MIYTTSSDVVVKKFMTTATGTKMGAVISLAAQDFMRLCSTRNSRTEYEGERVQRSLNKARARKFGEYLLDRIREKKDFIIPPLLIMLEPPRGADGWRRDNGYFDFYSTASEETLEAGTTVVIIDGQHRVEGIRYAMQFLSQLKRNERKEYNGRDLDYVTVTAMVLPVFGAEQMQQVFADVNGNASKPSKSINLFFDKANDFNAGVAHLIGTHFVFRGRTDIDKNIVSGKSDMIFTVAGVTAMMREFFSEKGDKDGFTQEDFDLIGEVLEGLKNLWLVGLEQNWSQSAEELRANSCAAHIVYQKAIMRAVRGLVDQHPEDWRARLWQATIPHLRSEPGFRYRCVSPDGRMLAGRVNAVLAGNYLKCQVFGLQLSPAEMMDEQEFARYLNTVNQSTTEE